MNTIEKKAPVSRSDKVNAIMQDRCDEFNLANSIGADVFVKLDNREEPFRTTTRSSAQVLSRHSAVVWLEGVTGCYLLDRVTPVASVELETKPEVRRRRP